MKIVNKWFKETVDYIDKNTELKIVVRNHAMSSITITGKVGEMSIYKSLLVVYFSCIII